VVGKGAEKRSVGTKTPNWSVTSGLFQLGDYILVQRRLKAIALNGKFKNDYIGMTCWLKEQNALAVEPSNCHGIWLTFWSVNGPT
jgi:hypothetical protein